MHVAGTGVEEEEVVVEGEEEEKGLDGEAVKSSICTGDTLLVILLAWSI